MLLASIIQAWFVFSTVAAEIVNVTPEQVVNETSTVTLECVVRANPVNVFGLITWYHVDNPTVSLVGARTEVVSSVATCRLFIEHASSRDAGLYRCVAYNGLGAQVNATVNLVVLRTYLTSVSHLGWPSRAMHLGSLWLIRTSP